MILRGIDFGPVLDASGVRGFFGEGYWFHKPCEAFGLDFDGSTFVSKTTTLEPCEGNMPAKEDGVAPREIFPRCVKVKMQKGVVLNAVGLSGPGAKALLESGRWQRLQDPFFISFMAVGKTKSERKFETYEFLSMLKKYLPNFQSPVGLQMNFSCPNVESHAHVCGIYDSELFEEAAACLADAHSSIFGGLPTMAKFNVLIPVEFVKELCKYDFCDGVCISNAIPWGKLPERIDWRGLFGSDKSPLAKFGGGGLSGKPLLPLVADWVRRARKIGITKPINAGGGILSPKDVKLLFNDGADSVFVGSAAILRPWRVGSIIDAAYQCAAERDI